MSFSWRLSSSMAKRNEKADVNATLKRSGEARGVLFNVAHLNPQHTSIPNDVVCASKAER